MNEDTLPDAASVRCDYRRFNVYQTLHESVYMALELSTGQVRQDQLD